MKTIVDIRNLCKSYKDFSLQNINMSLEEGTLTGFIGPNGSGKTTTIKSIINLVKPEAGSITVFGLNSKTDELQIKSKLGVVLDEGHFYDDMTLKKMKNLIAPMYELWEEETYQEFMKKFQLPENKRISELSGGMRMKYTLALALSHGAELLILDEATSGLDPIVRNELIDFLKEVVCDFNKTVLLSTHITSDLEKAADYLYFIYNGKIILHGQKDDLKESHAIIKGAADDLPTEYEKYFVGIQKSPYGFEGLTNDKLMARNEMDEKFIFEVPSIEDIMLYYTTRRLQ